MKKRGYRTGGSRVFPENEVIYIFLLVCILCAPLITLFKYNYIDTVSLVSGKIVPYTIII